MRGTVIKRGSKWSAVVDVGRDPTTGKRVRRWHSGFSTKKEAERAVRDLLLRVEQGTYVDQHKGRMTVREFLVNEWLPAKRATIKPSTFSTYGMYVNAYIAPGLGSVSLSALRAPELNEFYAGLLEHGRRSNGKALSPKMVRNIHGAVHKALDDAVRWGRLQRNPADHADPPKTTPTEMNTWTAEQLGTFIRHVHADRLSAAWILLATTGMRRGEVLGLRWTDVDLEGSSVTVRHTRTVVEHKVVAGAPKTAKGLRRISLDAGSLSALRAHRARQDEERLLCGPPWTDTGLLFTHPDGTEIHPRRLSVWFRQHARAAGLPPIRLHDVRHSYASALLRSGQSVKVVSQRIGHASPTITMTIYQHVLPSDDAEAARLGGELIFGSNGAEG